MTPKTALIVLWLLVGGLFFGSWYYFQESIATPQCIVWPIFAIGAILFLASGLAIFAGRLEMYDGYADDDDETHS